MEFDTRATQSKMTKDEREGRRRGEREGAVNERIELTKTVAVDPPPCKHNITGKCDLSSSGAITGCVVAMLACRQSERKRESGVKISKQWFNSVNSMPRLIDRHAPENLRTFAQRVELRFSAFVRA